MEIVLLLLLLLLTWFITSLLGGLRICLTELLRILLQKSDCYFEQLRQALLLVKLRQNWSLDLEALTHHIPARQEAECNTGCAGMHHHN